VVTRSLSSGIVTNDGISLTSWTARPISIPRSSTTATIVIPGGSLLTTNDFDVGAATNTAALLPGAVRAIGPL
jgi:hypothetical protein